MAIPKANMRAVAKYNKANYDEIKVRVPKGERETIQAHAERLGDSTDSFIQRAIRETIERDMQEVTQ